ncbi:hypothetical protein BDV41DRAFT_535388 [Aspergillus transmontanensis]|uniref:Secreted protein n=1 Tax=Aspergillus transmontanensis TaxID=1034304 RepID=A0A5N6W042_9EURO|nr:hypothetical protein BDV41DRAFT_535388 [Aspergillus transmontanensis]
MILRSLFLNIYITVSTLPASAARCKTEVLVLLLASTSAPSATRVITMERSQPHETPCKSVSSPSSRWYTFDPALRTNKRPWSFPWPLCTKNGNSPATDYIHVSS